MVGPTPVMVVHGPPGTGKTTTIAAASRIWDLCKLPVWIVAHSNVAVKNIAETLFKKDVDYRLLVSKEFYEEWHEHLYVEIEQRLIRSDELPKSKMEMERIVSGSSIILCTLSMISNPALFDNGTFEVVPLERLIIDESSQINVFEFMPLFERFQKTLEKVCFFGDPKQLPPFGVSDVPSLKTIFDLKHLQGAGNDYFLNTQYRMPIPIASFISLHVYGGRLLSQHPITSPDCLAFIDCPRTGEENAGFSTRNTGEIDTIIDLVKYYYRRLNFCVITPYDAQRAAIQKGLENAKLPWDSVYNVDSFQGNEADFVIVSVVRSSRAGFLNSLNRLNVLLTRCRKGLVIVSNRNFLGFNGEGSRTLLGKLVAYYRSQYPSCHWTDWKTVANASVHLPGVPAPNVVSLRHCGLSSYPIPIVSVNTQPAPYHLPTYDFFNTIAFPPLAPRMPLLKGSWANSVLKPLHPLSHVRRRENSDRNNRPTIHQTKSQCFIYSPPTMMNTSKPQNGFHSYRQRPQFSVGVGDCNFPRGTNHNNTTLVQRPYLERLRAQTLASQQVKNTKTRKMGKIGTKSTMDLEEQKPKSPTRKSEATINSGSFIRSIVVHSRPS